MSAALGRLPNAPLAYVLAQVRFEPFLEIEKYIPALQTSLRARYPRFLRTEQVVFQILPQPEEKPPRVQPASLLRWEFGSGSNHAGVIVQQDSLVFHVTAYETHEQFGQAWLWVMSQVRSHIPDLFVNRIGLRYVDFIVPNPDEAPEDYVVDRLRCDPALGEIPCQHHQGLTLAEYRLETGFLAVRYSRGTGRPTLPPDLSELSLQPSAIMEQRVADDQPTAILDIDRFMALSAAYDVEVLAEQFEQMHQETSVVFKALTTDHARVVWNRVPPG
jgi:uncharacterized protein (TIGR04255 family)